VQAVEGIHEYRVFAMFGPNVCCCVRSTECHLRVFILFNVWVLVVNKHGILFEPKAVWKEVTNTTIDGTKQLSSADNHDAISDELPNDSDNQRRQVHIFAHPKDATNVVEHETQCFRKIGSEASMLGGYWNRREEILIDSVSPASQQ